VADARGRRGYGLHPAGAAGETPALAGTALGGARLAALAVRALLRLAVAAAPEAPADDRDDRDHDRHDERNHPAAAALDGWGKRWKIGHGSWLLEIPHWSRDWPTCFNLRVTKC